MRIVFASVVLQGNAERAAPVLRDLQSMASELRCSIPPAATVGSRRMRTRCSTGEVDHMSTVAMRLWR